MKQSHTQRTLVRGKAEREVVVVGRCGGGKWEVGGWGGRRRGVIMTELLVLGLCMFVFPTTPGIYCRHWHGQPQRGEWPAG